MRLKTSLVLIIFLCAFSAKAQKNRYPEKLFEYGDYYYWDAKNIRGNIKKVVSTNFKYTFNKEDSTYVEYSRKNFTKKIYVDTNEILEFDRNRNLLKRYSIKQDSKPFLFEENKYNHDHQLIFHNWRSRHYRNKELIVHEEKEKRKYTSSGKLTEVWKISSYQKKYFIKRRYTYNENDLVVKYETFNAHIETSGYISCKGSSAPKDYVNIYKYDSKNRLIEQKQYAYEYRYDRRKEEVIDARDFSKYDKNLVVLYEYNEKNLIVKEVREHFGGYLKGSVNTITRKYDHKNRLIEDMTIHKMGHGSGHIYEYHEKEGELDKVVSIYLEKKKGIQTILKRITDIRKRDNESFLHIHYNKGRKVEVSHYNMYGDETLDNDLDDYEKQEFQYTYDKQGNWTSRIVLENGIKKERIVRTLQYYTDE